MKTGVIVAMSSELEALRRSGIQSRLSGIGKVNAARTATELILREAPDCIINSGVAGSVSPLAGLFDVVVASETAYHDVWCGEPNAPGCVEGLPQRFPSDPQLLEVASGLVNPGSAHPHVCQGLVCSGDQFFISMEEDRRILSLYPDALACDMESAAIAQVCLHYGVPFLSLRVISDVHTGAQEQKASYEDFWKHLTDSSFAVLKSLIDRI